MTPPVDPLRPASAATRVLPHGTRLGRYRLAQRLGVGGMAEVYLAVADGPHGWQKRVAIKLLHPHAAGHADRIAELHREARIAATLEHPNIAQVLDVGDERGEVFLAMEYVHGKSRTTARTNCRLLTTICNAMGLQEVQTFGNLDDGTGPLPSVLA